MMRKIGVINTYTLLVVVIINSIKNRSLIFN